MYPSWAIPPECYDILATLVLGTFGVWAREIYCHYDKENPTETYPLRFLLMIIPGAFSGFMGGEVASVMGRENMTWIFALVIGYGGSPILEMITQGVASIIKTGLEKVGVKFATEPAPEATKDTYVAIPETKKEEAVIATVQEVSKVPESTPVKEEPSFEKEPIKKGLTLYRPVKGVRGKDWRFNQAFGADFIHPPKSGKLLYKSMGYPGHMGIDYGGPKPGVGCGIYSPVDGVVDCEETPSGYGKHIRIKFTQDGKWYKLVLGHLASFEPGISDGVRVKSMQKLGEMGTTGTSTAIHLHMDIRETREDGTVIDKGDGWKGYFDPTDFVTDWA